MVWLIFRLIEKKPNDHCDNSSLPFSLGAVLSSNESLLIPSGKVLEDYTLVPVRFDSSR